MFQTAQFPFQFGLQEGQDPHHVPPGTLVTAENCRWSKGGRIEKRYGTTALARTLFGGGSLGAVTRLGVRGSELFAIDGQYLYAYSSAATQWKKADQVPDVGIATQTLCDNVGGVTVGDVAYASGLLVSAWVDGSPLAGSGTSLYYQVKDATTGAALTPMTLHWPGGTAVHGVRVLVMGGYAHIVWRDDAKIYASAINLTTLAVATAAQQLRTDVRTLHGGWDACVIGSRIVIAYENSPGNALKLYDYTHNGTIYTNVTNGGVTGEAGTDFAAVAVDGLSGERIWVAYYVNSSTKVRYAACDATTLAQSVAPIDVETLAGGAVSVSVLRYDSTHAVVAYTGYPVSGSAAVARACSYKVSTTAVDTTTKRGTWGCQFTTRIISLGGRYFAGLSEDASLTMTARTFSNAYVGEIEFADSSFYGGSWVPHRYIAKTHSLIASVPETYFLNGWAALSATKACALFPLFGSTPGTSTRERTYSRNKLDQVALSVTTSLPADMWRSVSYGQEAYLAGGFLGAYDGVLCFDYGQPGQAVLQSTTMSGGGSIGAGDYFYGCVSEYQSAAGVKHRSPTSVASTIVNSAGAKQCAVKIVSIGLTRKANLTYAFGTSAGSRTLLAAYRSTAGGTELHRVTVEPRFQTTYRLEISQPDTITDDKADSDVTNGGNVTLLSRPVIYTTGGVLDDESPPALTSLVLHKQRLWGPDGSGNQWWFSKSFLDDYGTAPGFSTSFRIQFDVPAPCGASMDDKLIVFAADRLWYLIGGENIAPNGLQSDLQGPFPIQSDVGCTNPRSVVSMPDGVLFQSARGIYLLGRGLDLVWVGRAVKDEIAAYPYITSAVLVADKSEIRFTANSGPNNTGNGIVLVYNYVEKQWTTSKYTCGAAGYGGPIADAIVWNGVWTFATPDGYVYQETTSSYLDAGSTWVPLTLETAWISASGPLAYHSVRSFQVEGYSNSNHNLKISVFTDGVTATARQDKTFQAGTATTSIGPLEECEITIGPHRRCQHIRFRVQDSSPTNPTSYPVGSGQGPSFDTMGIEFRVQRGFAVNPASKKG